MSKLLAVILLCFCWSGAWAHVVKADAQPRSLSTNLRASVHIGQHEQAALPQLATEEDSQDEEILPQKLKTNCNYMLMALCCLCCCGGVLKEMWSSCFGSGSAEADEAAAGQAISTIGMVLSVLMFYYLLSSGIYSAWWKGEAGVGFNCRVMCWWAIFQMVFWSIFMCCTCCVMGAVFVVKNKMVKKMKEDFDEKVDALSGPRKEYYKSAVFKDKCDAMFDKADVDRSGSLDMSEFQGIVTEMLGQEAVMVCPLLKECFDENHNSQVEKEEFVEMMKFVSVMQLQDGRFTVEQAFEVMLLPEATATMSDVSRSYRKLALQYHPDKRPGVAKDIVDKDMAEVNDSKAMLETHFKEKEKLKT